MWRGKYFISVLKVLKLSRSRLKIKKASYFVLMISPATSEWLRLKIFFEHFSLIYSYRIIIRANSPGSFSENFLMSCTNPFELGSPWAPSRVSRNQTKIKMLLWHLAWLPLIQCDPSATFQLTLAYLVNNSLE